MIDLMDWFFSKLLGALFIAVAYVYILPVFYPRLWQEMRKSQFFWTYIIAFVCLVFASVIVSALLFFYRWRAQHEARGIPIHT